LEIGITEHNFGRGPSKNNSTKVWLQLAQWFQPNLAESIYVRSSIKLLHLVPFGQQTWPLLLKIEHMVKLHVFGNNSKNVNNIKNGRQVMAIPHLTLGQVN
jgi:hypothetical protein